MSIEEERLKDVLNYVATKCRMNNWGYKRDVGEIIENYVGTLIPMTVTGFCEGKEHSQHVFIKLPSCDEMVRSFDSYMWDAEVYVYKTLVPIWKSLSNVKLEDFIPECYYADATPRNEVLVLKDMKYEGYRKYLERFLDNNHVTVSLKGLAQFHALSMLMHKNHIKLEAYVLRPYTHIYPYEINTMLSNSFRVHSQLFKGSKYEEYLRATLRNYEAIVAESTSKAKCLVYGHGDYWKENIMYKYAGSYPVNACVFDFQSCRVMSPARDFLFFILNATNSNLRRTHYKHFLNEYYVNLKNILCDNGVHLEKTYTLDDFTWDLKIVAPTCLIHIFMSFSLWLGFEAGGYMSSKTSWVDQEQKEKGVRFLKEILSDAMEDLCDYGYIIL